ncbi:MAG TPA: HEAT repeat domain-containing protein [Thermoanaerobaculia bacterium]
MKTFFLPFFLVALAASAQPNLDGGRFETVPAAGNLGEAVRQAGRGGQPVWVSWTVPVIEGQGYSCCLSRDWKPDTCRLEAKNQSSGSNDNDPRQDPYINVLVRLEGGKVERVRRVSATCPLDAGGRRFVWLEGVKPEESVRFLTELVKSGPGIASGASGKGDDAGEEALDALAFHRNAGALAALTDFATSPRYREDVREQSLFWLGQTRGREGYEVVARVLREDKDDELREHATFALSESPVPEAAELLLKTARADRTPDVRSQAMFWLAQIDHPQAPATILEAIAKDADPEVRSQAMFWLAQIDHPQAPALILEAIAKDADEEVREQGVFALSQLPKGKGVPLLIKLGRESKDREVRKQALFWLTESDDPAAVAFLEKMLAQ